MFGAIELLMIAIIFGIIYGRNAIDKTWNKHPDENIAESFAEDVKQYYEKDPKRLVQIIVGFVSVGLFVITLIYWVFTRYDVSKILGIT